MFISDLVTTHNATLSFVFTTAKYIGYVNPTVVGYYGRIYFFCV